MAVKPIPFVKMSGAGNDFILIDNRSGIVEPKKMKIFIPGICRRKMSVGADGVILIENSDTVDFKWRFFNSDGSVAEMCGNGARCAARFAFLNGIAAETMSFETIAGVISATVGADTVKIRMTDPVDLRTGVDLRLESGAKTVGAVNTGVPHLVFPVDDVETVDVETLGREIRYHADFAPAGTNVNFVSKQSDGTYTVRTYERGVEGETLACGTGNVAAAIIMAENQNAEAPISLKTRSGATLRVYFQKRSGEYREVYLEGDARIIYQGKLWEEAWSDLG